LPPVDAPNHETSAPAGDAPPPPPGKETPAIAAVSDSSTGFEGDIVVIEGDASTDSEMIIIDVKDEPPGSSDGEGKGVPVAPPSPPPPPPPPPVNIESAAPLPPPLPAEPIPEPSVAGSEKSGESIQAAQEPPKSPILKSVHFASDTKDPDAGNSKKKKKLLIGKGKPNAFVRLRDPPSPAPQSPREEKKKVIDKVTRKKERRPSILSISSIERKQKKQDEKDKKLKGKKSEPKSGSPSNEDGVAVVDGEPESEVAESVVTVDSADTVSEQQNIVSEEVAPSTPSSSPPLPTQETTPESQEAVVDEATSASPPTPLDPLPSEVEEVASNEALLPSSLPPEEAVPIDGSLAETEQHPIGGSSTEDTPLPPPPSDATVENKEEAADGEVSKEEASQVQSDDGGANDRKEAECIPEVEAEAAGHFVTTEGAHSSAPENIPVPTEEIVLEATVGEGNPSQVESFQPEGTVSLRPTSDDLTNELVELEVVACVHENEEPGIQDTPSSEMALPISNEKLEVESIGAVDDDQPGDSSVKELLEEIPPPIGISGSESTPILVTRLVEDEAPTTSDPADTNVVAEFETEPSNGHDALSGSDEKNDAAPEGKSTVLATTGDSNLSIIPESKDHENDEELSETHSVTETEHESIHETEPPSEKHTEPVASLVSVVNEASEDNKSTTIEDDETKEPVTEETVLEEAPSELPKSTEGAPGGASISTEEPIEEPVEQLVEEPAGGTPKVLTEEHIKEPIGQLTEESAEKAAEESAENAAEEPHDVPTHMSARESTEEPVVEIPTLDEPVPDESIADEPLADEPTAEEPTAEEPTAEEPTAEEPTAEEPTAEEPTAEEPTAEEPTTPVAKSLSVSGDVASEPGCGAKVQSMKEPDTQIEATIESKSPQPIEQVSSLEDDLPTSDDSVQRVSDDGETGAQPNESQPSENLEEASTGTSNESAEVTVEDDWTSTTSSRKGKKKKKARKNKADTRSPTPEAIAPTEDLPAAAPVHVAANVSVEENSQSSTSKVIQDSPDHVENPVMITPDPEATTNIIDAASAESCDAEQSQEAVSAEAKPKFLPTLGVSNPSPETTKKVIPSSKEDGEDVIEAVVTIGDASTQSKGKSSQHNLQRREGPSVSECEDDAASVDVTLESSAQEKNGIVECMHVSEEVDASGQVGTEAQASMGIASGEDTMTQLDDDGSNTIEKETTEVNGAESGDAGVHGDKQDVHEPSVIEDSTNYGDEQPEACANTMNDSVFAEREQGVLQAEEIKLISLTETEIHETFDHGDSEAAQDTTGISYTALEPEVTSQPLDQGAERSSTPEGVLESAQMQSTVPEDVAHAQEEDTEMPIVVASEDPPAAAVSEQCPEPMTFKTTDASERNLAGTHRNFLFLLLSTHVSPFVPRGITRWHFSRVSIV
jgi:hypothetical protein